MTDRELAQRVRGIAGAVEGLSDAVYADIRFAADEIDRLQREVERLSTTPPATIEQSSKVGAVVKESLTTGVPSFLTMAEIELNRQRTALAERRHYRAEAFREAATSLLDGSRPLPFDRDTLGRMVREAWVRWAQTQPAPKPSWLVPYDDLAEPDKEADRQIGEAIARWTLIGEAAAIEALATPETETSPDDR